MKHSDSIGKLAEALSKAQGEMSNASKDKDNTFFKNAYADLASVWDACRDPLSKHGLCVLQTVDSVDGKMTLCTKLVHSSGEYVESNLPINPIKNDPQGLGSAITYMRRYSLSALVGISPAEDDGEAAMGRVKQQEKRIEPKSIPYRQTPPPKIESIPIAPVNQKIAPERVGAIKSILAIRDELLLSDDQLKAEIHREFGIESLKALTADQLLSFQATLQAALEATKIESVIDSELSTEPTFASFQ